MKPTDFTTLKVDVVEVYDIPRLVEAALNNIYEGLIDTKGEIEPNLFKIAFEKLVAGIDIAFPDISETSPELEFTYQLKHNSAVFAAFKTHKEQNEIARLLLDADGKLKSFSQFKKDTEAIVAKNHRWLETEYDTAVLRARNSARWKEFERDADLFPNLKWTPSTSVEKRTYHIPFYNLVLPISHPFWKKNYPGDLWNCKCGITNTDEGETQIPDITAGMTPDKGLGENPAYTGKLFAKTHPVFTETAIPAKQLNKIAEKKANAAIKQLKKKE